MAVFGYARVSTIEQNLDSQKDELLKYGCSEIFFEKASGKNLIRPELKELQHKMLVWQPVTVSSQKEFNLHKILRAIELNTLITKLNDKDFCKPNERFKSLIQLKDDFKFYPQLIENTENLLKQCSFEFDFKKFKNKSTNIFYG